MTKEEIRRELHEINLKAEKAIKSSVAKAIADHAKTGDYVVIWRNGKVVKVPAEQLKKKEVRSDRKKY